MHRILTILMVICCISVYSGNPVPKAFKALRIYDYFKAKKLFYQGLKKNPAPAAYGLATIYLRKDNPFHNYDSAYKYSTLSRFAFQNLTPKKKKQLLKFNISDSTIALLCDSVFIKAHEHYMLRVDQDDSGADSLLNHYISYYFLSSRREDAIRERDALAFAETKKNYSSVSFMNYILTWPESYFINDAFYLLEKTTYEENTSRKTLQDFNAFIQNYPKNRFVKSAEDEIFFIHRKNRDKEGLINFIRNYPGNEHINDAWKLFFTLSVDKYTSANLAEFVLDYPDFPLKKTIIDEINLLDKQLLRIRKNDKTGFIDTAGNETIPPIFEEAEDFSEGLAIATEDEKYGYINKNGQWAINAVYDEAEAFQNGVAIVRVNKRSFVVDRTGTVISDEFDEINNFSEGLAVVKKGGKYGAVNRLGNVIIPLEYDKLGDFSEDHAWFQRDGKYGILDRQNYITVNNEYDWVDNYGEFIRVKKNSGYGVIDKNNQVIISFNYDRIENYSNEIFILIKNGKYGFADKSGCMYTWVEYDFDNKLTTEDLVWKNEKENEVYFKLIDEGSEAIMNQNGKKLADFDEYEEIYLPSNGLFLVMNRDKYSFLDLKMHPAFKGTFDDAEDFKNGVAIVTRKDKPFIIDKNGNTVFNEACDEIELWENDYYLVTRSGLKGILNKELKWLLQPGYQEIEADENFNYISLKKEGRKILYSVSQSKIIWSE